MNNNNLNTNKFPNSLRLLMVTILLLSGIAFSSSVHAQSNMALTVFPAIQEKSVKPGETTRMQIQFQNGTPGVVGGTVHVANYIVVDKEGTPQLIDDAKAPVKYSAGSWITPSVNEIAIPANNFVTVDLAVKVPNEIVGCGAYAIVYFQPDPGVLRPQGGNTESGMAMTTKIGGLINFSVSDKQCNIAAKIASLILPNFLEHGPIPVTFEVYNAGDIHIAPKSLVVVSNMFNRTVDQKMTENQNIFPETSKEFKLNFGEKWMIGRYKVDLTSNYGDNQRISKVAYIWVFPWKEASVILLAIIIIMLLINNMMKRSRMHEAKLEERVEEDKSEIEKLKKELQNKD